MRVFEETGRDLGRIKEVLKTGANDIYVVACPAADEGLPAEFLFPALRHLVVEISLEEKKMVVKIPEGLI